MSCDKLPFLSMTEEINFVRDVSRGNKGCRVS